VKLGRSFYPLEIINSCLISHLASKTYYLRMRCDAQPELAILPDSRPETSQKCPQQGKKRPATRFPVLGMGKEAGMSRVRL
jgi:hypothetical protein